MGLIERLRGLFAPGGPNPPTPFPKGKGEEGKAVGTPYTFPVWGAGDLGVGSLVDYESYADEGYARNAVVYACIAEIARTAPSAKLRVARDLGNGQYEPLEEHPLQAILRRPNPFQGQKEFLQLFYTYLNLDGNVFVIRERAGRRTTGLWLARPDRMRPVIDERSLLGFVYVAEDGSKLPFSPEDVIHVKFPNPADPYEGLGRGLPPLSAAAYDADVDNQATLFMKQFFKNAAVPFGLLKSKNILDDAEVRRIRERMKEQYSGESGWWELMVLDADAEYQQLGMDHDKMGFTDLRAISETRICAAFKVPPMLIGIKAGLDAATYSNYTQARRALWEDKIIPDNGLGAEQMASQLEVELGEGVTLQFDYANVVALSDDRNERFARAAQGWTGGFLTKNEARAEIGLPPVDGGDDFKETGLGGLLPAPDARGEESDPEGQPARDPDTQNLTPNPFPEGKGREEKADEALGAEVHKAVDTVSRAWEMRFYNTARERFAAEAAELEALARKEKRARKELDWRAVERAWFAFVEGEAIPGWASAFEPLFEGLLDEQGKGWAKRLGIPWNVQNPLVREFLQAYSLKFAERVGRHTLETLRARLIEAQAGGWPVTKLIDEVQGLYSEWTFYRAEMIARSETIRASNAGANEAYRQAGITRKEWFTAEDERVCPFCGEMHGKVVEVAGDWWKQGSVMNVNGEELALDYEDVGHPPLHPNCRCTILPVVEA